MLAGVGPFSALFALGAYGIPSLSPAPQVSVRRCSSPAPGAATTPWARIWLITESNDTLTSGAQPLFFLRAAPVRRAPASLELINSHCVYTGMSAACLANGCALVGGETADVPGVYAEGDFDIAGFIVGVVGWRSYYRREQRHGRSPSGPHPTAFTLTATRSFAKSGASTHTRTRRPRARRWIAGSRDRGSAAGDALLRPHPSYLNELRPALGQMLGIAHITGGGLIETYRAFLDKTAAHFDSTAWPRAPIFDLIPARTPKCRRRNVPHLHRTLGLGIVLAAREPAVAELRRLVPGLRVVGSVTSPSRRPTRIMSSVRGDRSPPANIRHTAARIPERRKAASVARGFLVCPSAFP